MYIPPIHTLYNCLKNTEKAIFYEKLNFFMRKIDEFSIKYVYLQQN